MPRLTRLARSHAAAVVALAGLAAVMVWAPTAFMWPVRLGLAPLFVAVASGNGLWGLVRLPALLWLGDITYPIYLLHGLVLFVVVQRGLPRSLVSEGPGYLAAVLAVDITLVLLCSAVFVGIERPAIRVGRRHAEALRRLGDVARARLAARTAPAAAADR